MSKFEPRNLILFLLLCAIAWFFNGKDETDIIRDFLTSSRLTYWLPVIPAIAILLDRSRRVQGGDSLHSFEFWAETVGDYFFIYLGSATSISLLKGLFMQHFYNQKSFIGFDELDLCSMLIVSGFLLWYSSLKSFKYIYSAIYSPSQLSGE